MKVIADTSALIDFLRARGETADRVAELLRANLIGVPAIGVFELLAGVRSPDHRHQRSALLNLVEIIPFDRETAEVAAALFTNLRTRGITIDNEDIIVAATAMVRNLPVLTANRRHFEAIPEVTLA